MTKQRRDPIESAPQTTYLVRVIEVIIRVPDCRGGAIYLEELCGRYLIGLHRVHKMIK